MWPPKRLRIHPPRLPILLAVVSALALFPADAARAQKIDLKEAQPPPSQPPLDRVEQLRRVVDVKATGEELKERARLLEKRIAELRTLGELRRALMLREWNLNEDVNVKLAEQDVVYRQIVGNRFKDTLKFFLDPKSSPDPMVRMALAAMIGEMGPNVAALTPADKSGYTRSLAPDLIRLLKDPAPEVRAAACRALGKINALPREVVPELKEALKTDVPAVREAAAEGFLSWVKTVDALPRPGFSSNPVSASDADLADLVRQILPALAPGLRDPDPAVHTTTLEVIHQAARAVERQVQPPLSAENVKEPKKVDEAVKAIPPFLDMWRPLFIELRKEGDLLARSLEDPSPRVRGRALQTVQAIAFLRLRILRWVNSVPTQPQPGPGAGRRAAPLQLASAQVVLPQPKEQRPKGYDEPNLVTALEPSVKVLARGINSPNARMRLAAVQFLDFLEEAAAPAAEQLFQALQDRDRFVRWAAARALGKISSLNPTRVVTAVAPLLLDLDIDVRMNAAVTIERFGPQATPAVPALTKSIAEMSDPEGLMAMLNTLRAIGGAGGRSAVPAIAYLLNNPVPRVRRSAAETLGSYGAYARGAEPALRWVLNDDEPEVRQAASDALLSVVPQPKR